MKNILVQRSMSLATVAFLVVGMLSAMAAPITAGGGNIGTVKIHSADTSAETYFRPNEPKVPCTFYLEGQAFAADTDGSFYIANVSGDNVDNGQAYPLPSGRVGFHSDVNGHWTSSPITLADGHYKLYYNEDQNGNDKHKVFWVFCAPDTAHISIGPSAVNDIGAGQTSHTFTVTVAGTAALSNLTITPTVVDNLNVNVTPAAGANNTCGAPTVSGDTATCTVTISSSSPAGPFTASATASGTVGNATFGPIATNGANLNSGTATKTFSCLTHNISLELSGAGKTPVAYTALGGGGATPTWTVTFFYSVNGAGYQSAVGAITQDTGVGTLIIGAGPISVSTPSGSGTLAWYAEIANGTTVLATTSTKNETLANSGNCSLKSSGPSPVSSITFQKSQRTTDGDVSPVLVNDEFGNPIEFTYTATAYYDAAMTQLAGSFNFTTQFDIADTNLDDFLYWTVCEVAKDGWVQVSPNGCATYHGHVQTATDFVNFKTVDLTATKSANPTFTRTYAWTLTKSVDKTIVHQQSGSATFNYTVTATRNSGTNSAWQVAGSINITNPNPIAVAVTVSDSIEANASCTITGGANVTVPANTTSTVGYTCTYSQAPASASQTNTASVSWTASGQLAGTSGSAQATASVTWGAPTTLVDDQATVTDTQYTLTPGTISGTQTYTYSKTYTVPTGCVNYDNTASLTTNTTATNLTASQSVRICGPVKGGLTIGYWSNKNGQAQILGANPVALRASLVQYAPFQDLTATAASGINSYIQGVIKAANASGASMNAMLKAQMLATALNVYFNPALGGTAIDLTLVCKNIAAGCTIYENTSSSFGSATSLTVSQLLAYAATQSNVGGSAWYGQVKNGPGSQELAKDTFDAINNNVAYAP